MKAFQALLQGWQDFFQNIPASDVLVSAAIIAASYFVAKIVYFMLNRYVKVLTQKTETTLDDRIIKVVERPFIIAIVIAGIYFALVRLAIVAPYAGSITALFSAVWMILGILVVIKLGHSTLEWYSDEVAPKTKVSIAGIIPTLKRVWFAAVAAVGAIILLGTFGIEISPLLASLGIAGLAIALAFQDTLANFFAGVYVTAERPIRIGDYIELESGEKGYVTKIGWRSTYIRELQNNIIIIPNSKLAQARIKNYYLPEKKLAVLVQVSVSYDSDLEKVEKVTIDVARKIMKTVKGAVKDFEPFIRYHTFGDNGIGFTVIMQAEEFVDQHLIKHEFVKALSKRYAKEGIEIPYPKRDVYLK